MNLERDKSTTLCQGERYEPPLKQLVFSASFFTGATNKLPFPRNRPKIMPYIAEVRALALPEKVSYAT